ncbi:hypothetical protein GCM10020295_34320 [Streptomyces cinereospinus]
MPIVAQSTETTDWVSRFADEVIEESERRAPGKPVVVASGLSPSGPVHLGNLREVMTPHLVADEIRRRGHEVRHLISWDDYDRYRKVPAGVEGVDESWSEHIGKPLTSVPAPAGSPHANWAEHFKAAMVESLGELGVEFDGISQTEQYTSGAYREQILHAMRHRGTSTPSSRSTAPSPRAAGSRSRSRSTRPRSRPRRGPGRPARTTAAPVPPGTSRTSPTAATARRT